MLSRAISNRDLAYLYVSSVMKRYQRRDLMRTQALIYASIVRNGVKKAVGFGLESCSDLLANFQIQ